MQPIAGAQTPLIPWLDRETDALVRDMIATMAAARRDLLASILYGSVARRDERPLGDAEPSDVDVLFVFDVAADRSDELLDFSLTQTLGLARGRHLYTPREVQVMLASRTLGEWDPAFVAHVARDGLLLFARGPLPEPLAGVRPMAAPAE